MCHAETEHKLDTVYKSVVKQFAHRQAAAERYYNARRVPSTIKTGDRVTFCHGVQWKGRNIADKFRGRWFGPYKVHSLEEQHVRLLAAGNKLLKGRFRLDALKLYHARRPTMAAPLLAKCPRRYARRTP